MHGPIGERVIRKEDSRLLTGNGQFSDDHSVENQAWAVMVRSPHAHAIIKSINATAALSVDGVIGVLSGEDCIEDRLGHIPHSPFPSTNFDMKLHAPGKELGEGEFTGSHMALPSDKVRYVGEAVAMVIAETRALANEAAELVEIEYEVLDSVTHALDAERDDAPRIWEDIPSNVFIDTYFGDQLETERAFAGADHVVKMSFDIPRVTGVPMEPRSALGVYDQEKDKYTLFAGSGGTVRQKREIAEVLGVPPEKVRVYALDVGGNFGTRNRTYVEFPLVVWASKKFGRPVKCTVERSESMVSDYQGRDLQVDMELAINREGKFLALRASNLSNVGARCVSLSPLSKGSGIITGSYRIPAAYLRSRAVFTNTAPTNAYRSSGRPEIIYCIERIVEVAAKECGFDPLELRRKNLISEAEMPYQNAVGMIYDSGKYEKSLDMAIGLSDFSDFEIRKIKAREHGKLLGRGIAHYVESSIGSPIEETQLRVLPDEDRIDLVIGTQPSGQGHETSFAQVAAAWLGVPVDKVNVIVGDTDIVRVGGGSHSGRSMRMAGTVIVKAAEVLIEKGKRIATAIFEASEADIEFRDGMFRVRGTDRAIGLIELARESSKRTLPEALAGGLSVTEQNEMHTPVFPNGCHICEIEVDLDTGVPEIVLYVAIDDVGRAINPLIVDGQTHGGIVQGVGQALWEECVFSDGQPLSGSFMDYGMPRADQFPDFRTALNEVPSPTNPLGVKAGGEGGTTPAPGVISNAIMDALNEFGVRDIKMPFTPLKIWQAMRVKDKAA